MCAAVSGLLCVCVFSSVCGVQRQHALPASQLFFSMSSSVLGEKTMSNLCSVNWRPLKRNTSTSQSFAHRHATGKVPNKSHATCNTWPDTRWSVISIFWKCHLGINDCFTVNCKKITTNKTGRKCNERCLWTWRGNQIHVITEKGRNVWKWNVFCFLTPNLVKNYAFEVSAQDLRFRKPSYEYAPLSVTKSAPTVLYCMWDQTIHLFLSISPGLCRWNFAISSLNSHTSAGGYDTYSNVLK